jgi:predicted HicB family RNase H-like nuclease
MPTFAELIDRGNATPEQLREALKRQRNRREQMWSKRRQEHTEKISDVISERWSATGHKKKKGSEEEQFNVRLNHAQREVLNNLSDKLGISKNSVMKVALMTLFNHHK